MKTSLPHSNRAPARSAKRHRESIPAEWAWHYRTLAALRDHLLGGAGDRARESCDAMERPSMHAEDLVDELYDRELARALPRNSADAFREVDEAIQRLKAGTYGRCEATGRRIPKLQLRAMPWRRSAGK